MNEKTLFAFHALLDAIKQDPRFLAVAPLEEEAVNDPEVKELSKAMQKASDVYEEATRYYGDQDERTIEARKALFAAKIALDDHPKSRAYSKALSDLNTILMEVENVIFVPFVTRIHIGGSRD